MFSTQASDNDPTILTEDEYTEIVVSDILNTPFHDFLKEKLVSSNSHKLIYSFLAYMKNEEPEVIATFNDCHQLNKDFYKFTGLKNKSIEIYKRPRGFPLKLGENEQLLFGFDYNVTFESLTRMTEAQRKLQQEIKPPVKRKNYSNSEDSFFDSCDDFGSEENLDNLKPIKKKTTLKPLGNDISEEFDEDDDMDLDDFDIPQPKMKEQSAYTAPDIALNRHISFGPIKSHNESSNKYKGSLIEDRKEEDKENGKEKPAKITKSPYSIASFIKESLKITPADNGLELSKRKTSLFGWQSNVPTQLDKKSNPFKTPIYEEEKGMDGMDMGEMDDLDDMDLDDLPEPTLK